MNNRKPFRKAAFLAVPLALALSPLTGFGVSYGDTLEAMSVLQIAAAPAKPAPTGTNRAESAASRHQQFEKALGLSPEQSEKIKTIRAQGRAQSHTLHQQLEAKRALMMKNLQSPNANEAEAQSLNAEINDLQRQISEVRLKTWFAMRAQLTPEQLVKLKAYKAERRANRHEGPHPGGPKPHGHPSDDEP